MVTYALLLPIKIRQKVRLFPAPLGLQKNKMLEGYASDDVVDLYTGKDLWALKALKGPLSL